MPSNPYGVGIGGFIVVGLYALVFAFLWRVAAAKLANADNGLATGIGAGMASIL
jgi:hypothetical protein